MIEHLRLDIRRRVDGKYSVDAFYKREYEDHGGSVTPVIIEYAGHEPEELIEAAVAVLFGSASSGRGRKGGVRCL